MNSKVADLSLADFGRKDIKLSEIEMPGLMKLREQYKDNKPLKNVKITGSLQKTVSIPIQL